MSSPAGGAPAQTFTCQICGAETSVAAGTRYLRCPSCEALYSLRWRGRHIDVHTTRHLKGHESYMDLESGELEEGINRGRTILRDLNSRIRQLEMSKGSERLNVLAWFVIICAVIYALFHFTVLKRTAIFNPGPEEALVVLVIAISAVVLILLRLRRAALVKRVRKLLDERDSIENEMSIGEAILTLRGVIKPEPLGRPRDDLAQAKTEEDGDIIGRFVTRLKEKRRRMKLRGDS